MNPSPEENPIEQQILAAVHSIGDGLILVNRDNRITYMNPTAEQLTGWLLQEAAGLPCGIVFHIVNAITREAEWHPVKPSMEDDRSYLLLPNSLLIRKDGTEISIEDTVSPMHDHEGSVSGASILFRDVGQNRATLLRVLDRVQRDFLTNLPNRAFFEHAIRSLLIPDYPCALLYLDLNQFKRINDTWGHLAGDVTLQVLARRIRETAPNNSTVCRWGGDEFVVLLRNVKSREEVGTVLSHLAAVIAEPIYWEGLTIHASVSIGLAFGAEQSAGDLLGIAERALHQAKHGKKIDPDRNGSSLEFVSPFLLTSRSSPNEQPVPETDVIVHYQPIVDLASGAIVGAEALARTQRAQDMVLLPADLIRNAEQNGGIVRLGQVVLRQALRQQAEWRRAGHENLCMNVNVSAVELLDSSYLDRLDRILEEESYRPSQVVIELTESALLHSEQQRLLIRALTERGLQIAIDDFGIGYSNLSYLRRFPISIIKIDRAFLRGLPESRQDANLVKAMIAMAQSLKCTVIAEGIETEAQRELLQQMQCSEGQGFLFSPAVPPERFLALCG